MVESDVSSQHQALLEAALDRQFVTVSAGDHVVNLTKELFQQALETPTLTAEQIAEYEARREFDKIPPVMVRNVHAVVKEGKTDGGRLNVRTWTPRSEGIPITEVAEVVFPL